MKRNNKKIIYITPSVVILLLIVTILTWQINTKNENSKLKNDSSTSDVQIVNLDDYENRKTSFTEKELAELKQDRISSQIEKAIIGMDKVSTAKVKIYSDNDEIFIDVKLFLFPTKKLTDSELDNIKLFIESSYEVSQSNINIAVF